MKIIHSDFKKGIAKIKVETLDDLWYLSHLIDPQDLISGKTLRKIKKTGQEERTQKVTRKPVFLKIQVDKIDFSPYNNVLRAGGKIIEGPDDLPKGSHHTFNLEEGTQVTIQKQKWLSYQKQKLQEATQKKFLFLICIFDREDAFIALSKHYGHQILIELHGEVPKKETRALTKDTFYHDLIKALGEYNQRYQPENIILASPAFYKEDLLKLITEEKLKKKIVLATCSSAKESALSEVLKRPELQQALKNSHLAEETKLVEEILTQISKNNLAAYGIREVKKAVEAGAVEKLLVLDALIQEYRAKEKYERLDYLMKTTDQTKGTVHIISSEHEGGQKLKGLGGIAALLRYKLEW
ncbi:mRNA surveillance protein pelota [Candidatus Woesearchaeota archaeon]|nr:mRNA surveillance protein pelota [Candidatus Woesearchaeota archaeon]